MIEDFYTTTMTQYRHDWKEDESENDYSELTEIADIDGHLQQMRADKASDLGMSLTKSFVFWCDNSEDVKENDVLESGSDKYTVSAVKDLSIDPGINQHLQVILQKQ